MKYKRKDYFRFFKAFDFKVQESSLQMNYIFGIAFQHKGVIIVLLVEIIEIYESRT